MALANTAVNRMLANEPWARERLAPFAGRMFMVRARPSLSDVSETPCWPFVTSYASQSVSGCVRRVSTESDGSLGSKWIHPLPLALSK